MTTDEDEGGRADRMDNEPPLGWDPITETIPMYRTLAEARAAMKPPIIIDVANPSMDTDDISDLGDYKWLERIK